MGSLRTNEVVTFNGEAMEIPECHRLLYRKYISRYAFVNYFFIGRDFQFIQSTVFLQNFSIRAFHLAFVYKVQLHTE